MEEIFFGVILRTVSIVVSAIAALVGLDLLLGAWFTRTVNRASKVVFDIDKSVDNPRIRTALGIVFLVFSLLIALLIKRV